MRMSQMPWVMLRSPLLPTGHPSCCKWLLTAWICDLLPRLLPTWWDRGNGPPQGLCMFDSEYRGDSAVLEFKLQSTPSTDLDPDKARLYLPTTSLSPFLFPTKLPSLPCRVLATNPFTECCGSLGIFSGTEERKALQQSSISCGISSPTTRAIWTYVWVLPKFICWNPIPHCYSIWRWGFWELSRSQGPSPHDRTGFLIRRERGHLGDSVS